MLQLLARALDMDLKEGLENGFPESAFAGHITIHEMEPLQRETYRRLLHRQPRASVSGIKLYTETEVVEEPGYRRRILPSELNSFALDRQRESAPEEELGPLFAAADGGARPVDGTGEDERALGTLSHRLIELQIHSFRSGGSPEPDPEWVAGLLKGAAPERQEELFGEARRGSSDQGKFKALRPGARPGR